MVNRALLLDEPFFGDFDLAIPGRPVADQIDFHAQLLGQFVAGQPLVVDDQFLAWHVGFEIFGHLPEVLFDRRLDDLTAVLSQVVKILLIGLPRERQRQTPRVAHPGINLFPKIISDLRPIYCLLMLERINNHHNSITLVRFSSTSRPQWVN